MALPPGVQQTLAKLIDSFSLTKDQYATDGQQKKLLSILREHYITSTAATTHARFSGLEEKCRIWKNDELANALVYRYNQITQWKNSSRIEVVAFLLHLSDRPVEKTRLEDLLGTIPTPLPADLTWKDLLEDDPYDETGGIWKTIDYAASSSDSSVYSFHTSDDSVEPESAADSIVENDLLASLRFNTGELKLEAILDARQRYLHKDHDILRITETQLIRESLFMLQGLPSALYDKDSDSRISLVSPCSLDGVSEEVVTLALSTLCRAGTLVSRLRQYAEVVVRQPFVQTFQACLITLLKEFSTTLSLLEGRSIRSESPAETLLDIIHEIRSASQIFDLLEPMKQYLTAQGNAFHLLQALFDLVVDRQYMGEFSSAENIAKIFFDCLKTYLRPIHTWLQDGSLDSSNDEFFVKRNTTQATGSDVWHKQFYLDIDDAKVLRAPQFMQHVAHKVFLAGKGVNLMRTIGAKCSRETEAAVLACDFSELSQSFDQAASFEESLSAILEDWVSSRSYFSDTQVLHSIVHDSKFGLTLSAIQHIFLGVDGNLAHEIALPIFEYIDKRQRWLDRFFLADHYQAVLQEVPGLEAQRISITTSKFPASRPQARSIESLSLFQINYQLPWSASIIIQSRHMNVFQNLATFMLQLRRADYLMYQVNPKCSPEQYSRPIHRLRLSLRQRLRWFIRLMESYITTGILEPSMRALQAQMSYGRNLNDLIQAFEETIDLIKTSCLLSDDQHSVQKTIITLLEISVVFSDLCGYHSKGTVSGAVAGSLGDDKDLESKNAPMQASMSGSSEHEFDLLSKYSSNFEHLLSFLKSAIQQESRKTSNPSLQILFDSLNSATNQT